MRRRSRWTVAVAAVVALVVVAALLALVFTRDSGGLSAVSPNSVGVIDPASGRLVDEVAVGQRPDAIEVGEGFVWAANLDDETISRIDPADIEARLPLILVDDYPSDLAVGNGAAWVALGRRGAVLSVDSTSGIVSEPIPVLTQTCDTSPRASVTLGGGFVWFACGSEGLVRVDPRTSKSVPVDLLGGTIQAGTLSDYPDFADLGYAGNGSLWIVNRSGNSVIEANVRTNTERQTITVGQTPDAIAVDDRTLWVANFGSDTVTRIDVSAGEPAVTTTIPVGNGPVDVAAGDGGVWVANQLDHTLQRIDPDTNEVVATVDVGSEPGGVAVGAGSVWVTVRTPAATEPAS